MTTSKTGDSSMYLTHYNYSDQDDYYEYDDQPSLTDISGFISETERLQGFIDAGQILSQYRSGYYDTDLEGDGTTDGSGGNGDGNSQSDPTDTLTGDSFADYGTDLADLSIAQRNIESRVMSRKLMDEANSKAGGSANDSTKTKAQAAKTDVSAVATNPSGSQETGTDS